MASNGVTIEAKLDEKGIVTGAKKITTSLEEIKRADGNLNWDGVKEGEQAAKTSGDGFTVLKGVFANLATEGIMLATSALKDFASGIVETGMGFETSMSKVSALSGATGDELGALEGKARELGASTTFSASEAADALGYMALAGWDTEEMLSGVGDVLKLAQAGEMDLASASDLVTDYLSAFNMQADEAGRMVDVLAYAQANANTTTEGLGMAFKNCAANANAAGMDVETVSAAISMMANQGLKGSEAGTALNAVLRDMTAKMEDGAIKIGEQTVAVMDAEGNYRDFADILADIGAATDGMGDAEKAAALQTTFTADSIKGLNLMLNAGADELDGFRDELYNCEGAAQETADVMTDNLGGDLAAMGSALEELQLKIYDYLQEPLRGLVQFITGTVIPGVEGFMAWLTTGTQEFDEFGNVVGETASPLEQAIGFLKDMTPALAAVAGGLLAYKAYSIAVAAAEKARETVTLAVNTAQKLLNGTMKANPIGIIITLIGALVAAFLYLWNTNEDFRNFWLGLWDGIMSAVGSVVDWFTGTALPAIQGFIDGAAQFFQGLWDSAVQIWNGIKSAVGTAIGAVKSTVTSVLGAISSAWSSVWGAVKNTATTIWNGIKGAITTAINAVKSVVTGTVNAISSTVGSVFGGIKNTATSIWNGIKGAIDGAINGAKAVVSSVVGAISSTVSGGFDAAKSTVTSVWNGIKTAITSPIETAKGIVDKAISTISGIICGAKLELPKIKVPHFNINGGEIPWGIGGKGTAPSVSIDWYAKGGVFDTAQIIGIGEAGREAALPLNDSVYNEIARGIARQSGGAAGRIDYDRMGAAVARALLAAGFGQTVIKLDGKAVGQLLAPHLDTINGARYGNAVRGLAQ